MRPRVAIVGVGGVGGVIAASLATARTCELTLVSRGAGLARLRSSGLEVVRHDGEVVRCAPRVVSLDDAAAAGSHDYVLVATKAHQLATAVPAVAALCDDDTRVVPLQNGLPFWFFHEFGGPLLSGSAVDAVDPGGNILRALPASAVIGCMSYVAGEVQGADKYERWLSKWPAGKSTLTLGEISVAGAERRNTARGLYALFGGETQLPLGIHVVPDGGIRQAVLEKLMVNASVNTLATLARADCGELCASPGLQQALRRVCGEVGEVAAALDVQLSASADDVLARYGGQYGLRPSMLQDLEAGRPLEREAIVDALAELGCRLGVATPSLDLLAALLETLDRSGSRSVSSSPRDLPAAKARIDG